MSFSGLVYIDKTHKPVTFRGFPVQCSVYGIVAKLYRHSYCFLNPLLHFNELVQSRARISVYGVLLYRGEAIQEYLSYLHYPPCPIEASMDSRPYQRANCTQSGHEAIRVYIYISPYSYSSLSIFTSMFASILEAFQLQRCTGVPISRLFYLTAYRILSRSTDAFRAHGTRSQ